MSDLHVGDRVRLMVPTKVPRGFVDCRTVLVISELDPLIAYWQMRDGTKVYVPITGEVDKVV